MSIFSVTAPTENENVAPAIRTSFPNQNIQAWDGHWFVSATGTTAKEVFNQIATSVPGGKIGTVIVVSVINYWGIASPEVWEWVKSRLENQ